MIALMLLSLILLLGAATTSLLLLDERAARNHRDHAQARLAAQAALEDACDDIAEVGASIPPRSHPRRNVAPMRTAGLCLGERNAAAGSPRSWWAPAPPRRSMASSPGALPDRQGNVPPRYLIERLPGIAGPSPGTQATLPTYRLNAVGYGRQRRHGRAAGRGAPAGASISASAASGCRWLAWRPLYYLHMNDMKLPTRHLKTPSYGFTCWKS
jgi:Tfp pilus assembly protein PilX